MADIKGSYANATVEEKPVDGKLSYVAYCDSDCVEEIDFVPDAAGAGTGDIVIWFVRTWWDRRGEVEDDRVLKEQVGYIWHGASLGDFEEIVSADSIGAAANKVIIRKRVADDVSWRPYGK